MAANCLFFSQDNVSGSLCTNAKAVHGKSGIIQINAVGSTDFDIQLEVSLDGNKWVAPEQYKFASVDSSSQPFFFSCVKARYIRVCFEIRSGSLDIEAYLA